MNFEQKAREFAMISHRGQFRKDGKTPYITHPEAVVKLLRGIGITNQDILSSGWLHDVVEDCDVRLEEIERQFNPNVARIVGTLTQNGNRVAYNEGIRSSDYSVQIVKLADVVHNCSEIGNYLPRETIEKKIRECEDLYLDMAKRICSVFHNMLESCLLDIPS